MGKIRIPLAYKAYFRDPWNIVDILNYVVFIISCSVRIYAMSLVAPILKQQEELAKHPMGPYNSNMYVYMGWYAFLMAEQTHITAINAILTWIKVFKFLDFHPSFNILIRTLGFAAGPLA